MTVGVFLSAASGICSPSVPTWNCSLPGPAGQQRVVGVLQAGRAGQVATGGRVGEAEQVGGRVPIRVDAAVAGLQLDTGQPAAGRRRAGAGHGAGSGGPGQFQRLDLVGGLLRDVLLEHHVLRRGRVLEQAEDIRLGHPERPGQVGGDLRLLSRRHHHRVRVDQIGLHGDGQRLAVGGRDVTAHGGQGLRLPPLVFSDLHKLARLERLELDQPADEQRHHERDGQQCGPKPPTRVGPGPQDPPDHRARPRRAPVANETRSRGGRMIGRPRSLAGPQPRAGRCCRGSLAGSCSRGSLAGRAPGARPVP